jgi:hypothetical protein
MKSMSAVTPIQPVFGERSTPTHFLNVDVDVWSKSDLQPLVAALGKKIFVHCVGAGRKR